MFFVYSFNMALEDYEITGAYSKRDEADAFLATLDSKSKVVVEQSWQDAMDHATTARIGAIAKALEVVLASKMDVLAALGEARKDLEFLRRPSEHSQPDGGPVEKVVAVYAGDKSFPVAMTDVSQEPVATVPV